MDLCAATTSLSMECCVHSPYLENRAISQHASCMTRPLLHGMHVLHMHVYVVWSRVTCWCMYTCMTQIYRYAIATMRPSSWDECLTNRAEIHSIRLTEHETCFHGSKWISFNIFFGQTERVVVLLFHMQPCSVGRLSVMWNIPSTCWMICPCLFHQHPYTPLDGGISHVHALTVKDSETRHVDACILFHEVGVQCCYPQLANDFAVREPYLCALHT